jgi:Rieske Fe-S protein
MTEDRSTRRRFLTGLAALPFVGGLFVALRLAAAPAMVIKPKRVPLGPLSAVPDSGLLARPVSYELRRGPAVESIAEVVFLSRDPDSGAVIALSSRCTHLGCPVLLDADDAEGPLHCPCHDARFAADGRVLEGPPPRPLERLEIVVPEDSEGTIEWVLP